MEEHNPVEHVRVEVLLLDRDEQSLGAAMVGGHHNLEDDVVEVAGTSGEEAAGAAEAGVPAAWVVAWVEVLAPVPPWEEGAGAGAAPVLLPALRLQEPAR